jgi:hypothetical protein
MKKSFIRAGVLATSSILLAAVLFISCNKKDHNDNPDVPVAGVMAFNLAPDVQSASITLSGNILTNQLAFGSYTGTYLAVFTGARPVESFNSTGGSLASANYTFDADKYYSVFVVGTANNYRNVIVSDSLDTLSNSGPAYIRYINAIPDSSKPAVTIAAGGTNVINDNASFAAVSGFKAITPGQVMVNVSNGGTINSNRTITVEQRKVYTVLLQGTPSGTGDQAVQIKYILNGTLNQEAGRASSAAARATN